MKHSLVPVLFFLLLYACGEQGSLQQASDTQEGLDLSRTTPLHNTPSRLATDSVLLATLQTSLPQGEKVPQGMVFVPGGLLDQGATDGLPREQPLMHKAVQGFFMDLHEVTVGQYRAFVNATGYVTQAEKFGNSIVFDLAQQGWTLRDGANWQFPLGPEEAPASEDHPATHISWNDAVAYCNWAGRRLPTEAEFEHAARNGKNTRQRYGWGQDIRREGRYYANIWQGNFPFQNTGEDGYLYTAPVGNFNENELGIQDLSGNVWEWCADWYMTYGDNPVALYDNTETREREKVMRGGSFMCDPSYCHGYRVSGRSGSTPESGLFHVGFRTVQDIQAVDFEGSSMP